MSESTPAQPLFVKLQPETIVFLRGPASDRISVGDVLCGGAARCKPLEREARDSYPRRGRHVETKTFDADFVATSLGLLYVVPRAPYLWERDWSSLRVEFDKVSHFAVGGGGVVVRVGEQALNFHISRPAVANLLEVAARYGAATKPV